MEELISEFYKRLAKKIQDEIEPYPLGMRKLSDYSYIIGDNVDLYDVKDPYGPATNSQLLLYINHRKPHIITLHERKNYSLPHDKIFQYTDELLTQISKELQYKGIIHIDYKKHLPDWELRKKTMVRGKRFSELVRLAYEFPNIQKNILPDASYQWKYGDYSKFEVAVEEEALFLKNKGNDFYKKEIKSKKDLQDIMEILKEREEEIFNWKEQINQILSTIEHSKWVYPNSLMIGNHLGKIYHIRTYVKNSEFCYSYSDSNEKKHYFKTIDEMLESAKKIIEDARNED